LNFIIIFFLIFLLGCDTKEGSIEEIKDEKNYHISKVTSKDSLDKTVQEVRKEKSNINQVINDKKSLVDNSINKAVLWRDYRRAKEKAKIYESQNNYEKQIEYLQKAAEYAHLLGRFDIEAWQYNNAGYTLIKKFKAETDYYNKMKHLNSLVYKSEIIKYKEEIISQMRKKKDLLIRAKVFLEKAETLDKALEKSHRRFTIANNLLFISDCDIFLEQK